MRNTIENNGKCNRNTRSSNTKSLDIEDYNNEINDDSKYPAFGNIDVYPLKVLEVLKC